LTSLPDGYWRWQPLYADALVDRGRLDEAVTFLDEHDGRWTRSTQARLDRARGRVEAQRDHDAAEAAFTRSVHTLAALRMPYEQALSELAFGQFLRRRRRRTEATLLLKAARSRLAPLAATPALERCERELGAVGHRQPRRPDRPELTPQERTVAQLVARGKTNREVADELLVSVRTVEAHLTRIYAKVGVNTRAALAARLARD
jgi:DNA-binding CsgD family transcriptional regulator